MLERQKIILKLLQLSGGSAPRLKLVKLAFLLGRSGFHGDTTFYRFLPYKYGPFSFTMYHELLGLARDGYIIDDADRLSVKPLSKQPTTTIKAKTTTHLRAFWDDHGHLPTGDLVNLAYSKYPWFTVNSERKERRASKRPVAKPAVFTAGYEGLQVDDFLDLLMRAGVQRLIDVRNNPISRRYGFHKGTLTRLCEGLGIEYRHFPQVGIPSAWRSAVASEAGYSRLFERYRRDVLPEQPEVIREVADLVNDRSSVLVCQEREACRCHRSHLADRVAALTGLPILNLGEDA
jgi:uncharacterized protein (DUF488 family)